MTSEEKELHIAIDGPAASGKTTVGKLVAKKINALFFDTGLVYRSATWFLLKNGCALTDSHEVMSCLEKMHLTLQNNPETQETEILINGVSVSKELHLPNIDKHVSIVSAIPEVRQLLTSLQREIGLKGRTVLVGRDIGTVVLPDADIKVYLKASAETRALRRFEENQKNGIESSYQDILTDLIRRDQIDSSRQTAPLKAAADAHILNTDDLTADKVAERILELVNG
ncbi:MAG: (d)CMP kinase [Chloroflexi bacterium]|nr:(d)CMP kinase [Chloroflexota bacterium]